MSSVVLSTSKKQGQNISNLLQKLLVVRERKYNFSEMPGHKTYLYLTMINKKGIVWFGGFKMPACLFSSFSYIFWVPMTLP